MEVMDRLCKKCCKTKQITKEVALEKRLEGGVGEEVRKISGEMIQAELGASAKPEVGSVERVESTPKTVGKSCKKLKFDDSYILHSLLDMNNVAHFVLCTQKYSYS